MANQTANRADCRVLNRARATLFIVGLAVLAAGAPAETYYVDGPNPNASDQNAGGKDEPFKTPAAAIKAAKAGDTVVIRSGVYRGSYRMPRDGQAGKPITIRAAKGHRPVLTGAVRITGWKKCSADDAPDAPKGEKLFVVDLDWRPKRLFEGLRQMSFARTPDAGWWGIGEGLSLTEFTSPKHLTQKDAHAWTGWTVAILEQAGGSVRHIEVAKFDPGTHKITLATPYSRHRKKINPVRDRFYMANHLSTLDGPGQYVLQKRGGGWRLYVWPSRLGDDGRPIIEAPKHGTIFEVTGRSYLTFDGLEVCFSTGHGIGVGNRKPSTGILIRNCVIHHCPSYGVGLRGPVKATVRRCVIWHNGNGIVLGGSTDCVVEENDIGWNFGDGVVDANGTRNLIIRRNFIHDHYLWGHPDNIQFWSDVRGVKIDGNLLWNGGQTMMSHGMTDCSFTNNLVVGSRAVAVICAAGKGWRIRNNTIVAVNAATNFQGSGFSFVGNIVAPLNDGPCYSLPDDSARSDHNLLWVRKDYGKALVVKGRWKSSAASLDDIRKKYGQEAHGLVADPKFVSAATFLAVTDYRRVHDCTDRKFIVRPGDAKRLKVGDHVELDFDGVARKIVKTGEDFFEVEKPLPAPPTTMQTVVNWGQKSKVDWDLRLAPGSPARKAGKNGRDIGSTVDLKAFRKCDFDGDGKRDVPAWPPAEPNTDK